MLEVGPAGPLGPAETVKLGFTESIRLPSRLISLDQEVAILQIRIDSIRSLLEDAHNEQFLRNDDVRDWIQKASVIVHDAENVIDLYEAQHRAKLSDIQGQDRRSSKVRRSLSSLRFRFSHLRFLFKTACEVRKINVRLSNLPRFVPKFQRGIITSSNSLPPPKELASTSPLNTSPELIKMIGRENDEKLILRWLTNEVNTTTHGEFEKPSWSVVAIVGPGGVGKTTLAKKICNELSSKKDHFEKLVWVCTSENPGQFNLFRKVLESFDDSKENEEANTLKLNDLDALYVKIRRRLSTKKCLLVLDDLRGLEWWDDEFQGILETGRIGSTVLITTREVSILKGLNIPTAQCLELQSLSVEESWDLFKSRALLNSEEDDEVLADVKDIVECMVKKCCGLPLALSVVGSLFRADERRIRAAWQGIDYMSLWEWGKIGEDVDDDKGVLGAIALSYMRLPFPLKQCLTYCCLFPKGYRLRKEMLVELWVAEGFVKALQDDYLGEEEILAEHYLQKLVDCCLIQREEAGVSGIFCYTLHAMVHEFSLDIRRNEFARDPLQTHFFYQEKHHESDDVQDGDELRIQEQIQTPPKIPTTNFQSVETIARFQYLRVLDISRMRNVGKLPDSVCSLVLLRYLNVGCREVKELPESIGNLRNLQVLDVSHTQIETLPEGILLLTNLRHLHLEGTSHLKCLPKEIRKLTCLRTLTTFPVGSHEGSSSSEGGCNINQLGHLKHLRGKLWIKNIEKINSPEEAKQAQIREKRYLTELELLGVFPFYKLDSELEEKINGVYEELHPPNEGFLQTLTLWGYAGRRVPSWLSSKLHPHYPSLSKVVLGLCNYLEELPPLGSLPSIVKLEISFCRKVKAIDREFYFVSTAGTQTVAFPKLEELEISYMVNFIEWRSIEIQGAEIIMPRLRRLKMRGCPKLKALQFDPGLRIENLTKLQMEDLPLLNFVATPRPPKRLEELQLDGLKNLHSLWVQGIVLLRDASTLTRLVINASPELELEPKEMKEVLEVMKSLKTLELRGCPKFILCLALVLEPHHLPSVHHLHIYSFHWSDPDLNLYNYSAIAIEVESEGMSNQLRRLGSLGNKVSALKLKLGGDLCYLPEWVQCFHRLKKLHIEGNGSTKMAELPEWLGSFPELRGLHLSYLPELRNLPNYSTSLTKLEDLNIYNCPKFEHLLEIDDYRSE